MFRCPKCNDRLEGDGYTKVIHCPNVNESDYEDKKPDANPVYCCEDRVSEDVKDELHRVDVYIKDMVRSLVSALRFMKHSDKEVMEQLEGNAVLKALILGREIIAAGELPDSASAAIEFALNDSDGIDFLRLWSSGEFDVIRCNWPDAPEEVYVSADPLYYVKKEQENGD